MRVVGVVAGTSGARATISDRLVAKILEPVIPRILLEKGEVSVFPSFSGPFVEEKASPLL